MLNPFNHIDVRVNDMGVALPFYTSFLRALSFSGPRRLAEQDGRTWELFQLSSGRLPSQYVGLMEERLHRPNLNRVAFHLPSRHRVLEITKVLTKAGAENVEGPVACPEYSEQYFAVFFNDPSGNPYEVCCHLERDTLGSRPDLDRVLARFDMPASFSIEAWSPNYFDAICALSSAEGWTTPELRPKETLVAWENSWPTLVAVDTDGKLVGFLRAITDTQITTYLCEVLVAREFRRLGLGRLLVDVCQGLVPTTRLDLLSMNEADDFYRSIDCADFQGFRRRSECV